MSIQTVYAVATPPKPEKKETAQGGSAHFHPSVWGDHFISYAFDDAIIHAWSEEANILKEQVRRTLTTDIVTKSLEEKLKLLDSIQRLGISYHFTEELEKAMKQIHDNYGNFLNDTKSNLQTRSLLFRLLREYGYNIPSDIFNELIYSNGHFKEFLTIKDMEGILSLYEATHMRVHEESILDEALTYVTTFLQSIISNIEPYMAKHVVHALRHPIRKGLVRLESVEFISFYQENKSHNEALLKLAKLDFNILQKQHQKELSIISMWWKNLALNQKFPFARDRLVECYFWALGVFYEPQYALARIFLTKVVSMTSIIDDIFDNYGTKSEREAFTEALERWEMKAKDELPEYMKVCYQGLLDLYDEMEEEMGKEGRAYVVGYAKEAMKRQVKAYYEEAKWLGSEELPILEEYLKIALVTSGYPMLVIVSYVGMGEYATKEVFDWVLSEPQLLKAATLMCRLMNDMVPFECDQQRHRLPTAVDCYMNQYKVSKQKACDYFNKAVSGAWKDINQAFFEHQAMPMTILMKILNFARVMDLLYKEEDFYSNAQTKTKQYIARVLVNPMEIS